MIGVMIGEKHTYNDFGLILSSKVISPPEPQLKSVTVPLRDGSIDLTASLTDDVKYNDRKITLTFSVIDPMKTWSAKISEVENYLHGQRLKIIFDDDAAFYYVGRVSVNQWTSSKAVGTLVIECTVEPYKYDVQSSADDWLWDPFDFENGYISEAANVDVDGSATITILGRRKRIYPIIIVSAAMKVSFEGSTYNLAAGSNKIYELLLHEGENNLIFTGSGTVTVEYTGGSL